MYKHVKLGGSGDILNLSPPRPKENVDFYTLILRSFLVQSWDEITVQQLITKPCQCDQAFNTCKNL